jgi:Na+/H+ antiporter
MHSSLLLCLSLVLVVSLLVMLGQRLRISYPIFLVLGGLVISFIPGIPRIEINPELIFLIFLPPLLYEAAWFTSWKDFWKWRRVIGSFAFGLVILTACIVAFVSHAIIPGFTLALGFLLGGIISPPDAVAATSVLKGLKIPKRLIIMLEGESLVNDASSLIVFRFALAAVVSGTFVLQDAAVDFVLVTVLGTAIGVAIAMVLYVIFRWLPTTPSIDTALSFVAPYVMYLVAEAFNYSGVMAVVSGGLFLSYRSHQIFSHASRLQGLSMWATVGFILNGLVFMLIGLELPVVMNSLGNYSKMEAIGYALIITLVVILTRIAGAMGTSIFTKLISHVIRTNDPNPGWRSPLIIGWAGMRGVVSLASALSIPIMINGAPFPHRNLILFITFVVILVTLVVQGLTLPLIIRWVDVKDPDGTKPEHEQEAEVQLHLKKAALQLLHEKYADAIVSNQRVKKLEHKLENDIQLNTDRLSSQEYEDADHAAIREYQEIFTDLVREQRQVLHELRKQDGLDDEVIRRQEAQMDLEEEKLQQVQH